MMTQLQALTAALLIAIPMTVLAQSPEPSPLPPAPPEKIVQPEAVGEERLSMTEADAKSWVRKDIYSSDGEFLGEVAAIARNGEGEVVELQADIGSNLGLGETRVRISPSQFTLDDNENRVVLKLTAEEARELPEASN